MMSSVNPSISQILYRRDDFNRAYVGSVLNARWWGSRLTDFNLCCRHSIIYVKNAMVLNRVHVSSDGSVIAKNLLQCIGEYCLVHQLADMALNFGHAKAAERLSLATEKLGNLCLRYCVRFLVQNDQFTAKRYFRLAEAIFPGVVDVAVFKKLSDYWNASSEVARRDIIAKLNDDANVSTRAVSYSPPPESVDF